MQKSKLYFRYVIDFIDINFRDLEDGDTSWIDFIDKQNCRKFLKLLKVSRIKFHSKQSEIKKTFGVVIKWYDLFNIDNNNFASLRVESRYHITYTQEEIDRLYNR